MTSCRGEHLAYCRGLCRACYARAWRADPPSARPKLCRHCGASYTGRAWNYCSAECRRAANLAAPRDRRTLALTCPTCGRDFHAQPRTPRQRFCSLACRPHRGGGRLELRAVTTYE